ncbi:MAG TPA: hypothetical protein VNR70_11800, partial [Steroidobacteraceae bacterium]|nr:hypothetical protein [Steroidobacteraceae bacterium]
PDARRRQTDNQDRSHHDISFDHHRPQCVLADALFVESSSAFAAIFYLQTAIADIIIALNLVFSTLPSFICCSFLTYFSVIYHTQALMSTAGATV